MSITLKDYYLEHVKEYLWEYYDNGEMDFTTLGIALLVTYNLIEKGENK